MSRIAIFLLVVATLGLGPLSAAAPAQAQTEKPGLFVNLTSDEVWRGWMALHFAYRTRTMGHPVTVFLNLEAVRFAWAKLPPKTIDGINMPPQKALRGLIDEGGVVLVCGPCLDRLGIAVDELIAGAQLGKPGLTQSYMFAEGTRIVSW